MFFISKWRRQRLRRQGAPSHWHEVIERRVPLYRLLPPADREELLAHVQVFLAEKRFEGVGGVEVTEEMRLTIAAQACILLLHRPHDYYPKLSSVVVYADEYLARVSEVDESGVVTEGVDRRSGESWEGGAVALSWEDVLLTARPGEDDYNVVIHEFAHQLDTEEGISNDFPLAAAGERVAPLVRLLYEAYEELAADVAAGRETVFDAYGAESPAEFFAVATECFFGLPRLLREWHPELYGELCRYFRQDPAAWERPA